MWWALTPVISGDTTQGISFETTYRRVGQLTSNSKGQNGARMASWSPNNSQIVYFSDSESFSWDIWLMNADGSGQQNLTKGRVTFIVKAPPELDAEALEEAFEKVPEEQRGVVDWEIS